LLCTAAAIPPGFSASVHEVPEHVPPAVLQVESHPVAAPDDEPLPPLLPPLLQPKPTHAPPLDEEPLDPPLDDPPELLLEPPSSPSGANGGGSAAVPHAAIAASPSAPAARATGQIELRMPILQP
jgi:hypothetical protein